MTDEEKQQSHGLEYLDTVSKDKFRKVVELTRKIMENIPGPVNVLEIGCGDGAFAIKGLKDNLGQSELNRISYTGVDIDINNLQMARVYSEIYNFDFHCLDSNPKYLTQEEFFNIPDASFDIVYLIRTLHDIQLKDLNTQFYYIFKLVKSSGNIIIFDKSELATSPEVCLSIWENKDFEELFEKENVNFFPVKGKEDNQKQFIAVINNNFDNVSIQKWERKIIDTFLSKIKNLNKKFIEYYKIQNTNKDKLLTGYHQGEVKKLRELIGCAAQQLEDAYGYSKLLNFTNTDYINNFDIYTLNLPSTSEYLFGRENELTLLDSYLSDEGHNIICIVAWGGVGKTSLVKRWLNNLKTKKYKGVEKVYAWSFYSKTTNVFNQASSEVFLEKSLEWFGDQSPNKGDSREKGVRLAKLVCEKGAILILDGIESLQYPSGERQGQIRDQGIQALLKQISKLNFKGLCIITTRISIKDFADSIGFGVEQLFLDNLTMEASIKLLKIMGVKGTKNELEKAVFNTENHALAITLLATYICTAHEGNIECRDCIPKFLDERQEGGHARRILESYEKWLIGSNELLVMYLISIVEGPIYADMVNILRKKSIVEKLYINDTQLSGTNWWYSVRYLRKLYLISNPEPKKSYKIIESHPLIKEYFSEAFKAKFPIAWREANNLLFKYYKGKSKFFPSNLEELSDLYNAIIYGCRAGECNQAFSDIFWQRILRKEKHFSINVLGAIGSDLYALVNFFETPWEKPICQLNEKYHSDLVHQAGYYLYALGRLEESIQPYYFSLRTALKQKKFINASTAASNISRLFLQKGKLSKAERYALSSIKYANKSDNPKKNSNAVVHGIVTLAKVLHQKGDMKNAKMHFENAERLQAITHPSFPYLYGLLGYDYCDFLLDHEENIDEALRRSNITLKWAEKQAEPLPLEIGLQLLNIGNCLLSNNTSEHIDYFIKSIAFVDKAVSLIRKSGMQIFIPYALIIQAKCYRLNCKCNIACQILDEAIDISAHGQMNLHIVDCYLEYSHTFCDLTNFYKAKEYLDIAKRITNGIGYKRRIRNIEYLENLINSAL